MSGKATRDRVTRQQTAVTIYDIAQETKLDPSTVSRALSGTGRVSAKTRERVTQVARELGYRANPAAQTLNSGRTRTLALIVADITNPLVFDVVRGAERAANARGYTIIISESGGSRTQEMESLDRIIPNVDGVVLGTTRLTDDEILEVSRRIPVGLTNRKVDGIPGGNLDLMSGIDELVDHLAELGHKHVTYVSGPAMVEANVRRLERVRLRAMKRGMKVTSTDNVDSSLAGGRSAAEAVIESGATATIAFNDLIAIGLLQELVSTGISIPEQLSIAGFDDIFGSDFTNPTLTTVQVPLAASTAATVSAIIAEIEGTPAPDTQVLATTILVRESTGPVAGR